MLVYLTMQTLDCLFSMTKGTALKFNCMLREEMTSGQSSHQTLAAAQTQASILCRIDEIYVGPRAWVAQWDPTPYSYLLVAFLKPWKNQ